MKYGFFDTGVHEKYDSRNIYWEGVNLEKMMPYENPG